MQYMTIQTLNNKQLSSKFSKCELWFREGHVVSANILELTRVKYQLQRIESLQRMFQKLEVFLVYPGIIRDLLKDFNDC
ncbi:hypothetical protein EPI10_028329 [Gossypium australe]|uniref:Uncharacterized protein n=1 Tax=Gossypium australe TaxID=47621 RepID=A0A5B6UUH1_9ROSI|nr:hypothetical protein EPI10_028329 [Gossypium australe]